MTFEHLFNPIEETECDFSPDGNCIITGVSDMTNSSKMDHLVFFDTKQFQRLNDCLIQESTTIVKTIWHSKLNQIILSFSDGTIQVLFDDDLSIRGAKLCADKKPRLHNEYLEMTSVRLDECISSSHDGTTIINERSLKRKSEKSRSDPIKSHRPELPMVGQGRGGRVGSSLTAHLMKNIIKDTSREEDPREALLRHAKSAEEHPIWVAPAYQHTQPKPIFSEKTQEQEEQERITFHPTTPSSSTFPKPSTERKTPFFTPKK
jgi:hypothetical protein